MTSRMRLISTPLSKTASSIRWTRSCGEGCVWIAQLWVIEGNSLLDARAGGNFCMTRHPTEYAHPEALVETDWLEEHLKDDRIRIVESNEDILLYDTGHIPGAVHIDWRADLQDPVIRDYISPEKFARLCSRHGITSDTTCIFYGDKANWWACYALWAFRLPTRRSSKLDAGTPSEPRRISLPPTAS